MQAEALKLVAKKLQSSLAVEGELPEDGLAAYGDDGDDLMMALARRIVNGEDEDQEPVESVFARARESEVAAEEMLVDDDWRDGDGADIEMFVDGGHDGEAANQSSDEREARQTIFSWAEFMAEEPGEGRGRKPKPASTSLFEWALGMEEEREAQTVS